MRKLHHPIADARLNLDAGRVPLSVALSRVKLERKGLGTDITHGTSFFTPILTLLARQLGTRRQDMVYCAWPALGCPFVYFSECLKEDFAWQLAQRTRDKGVATLHELIDLLQSVFKWDLKQIIEWVKAVEQVVGRKEGLMETLQAAADGAREMHDRDGMQEARVGMTEGIVIPVDGIGRVN